MSVSKLSRLLCLLLCLSFFLVSFGSVDVHAASEENLISPNITTWEKINDANNVSMASSGGYQSITINPVFTNDDYAFPLGGVYDLSKEAVKVGDIYRLSLEFLNGDRYLGSAAGLISSAAFLEYDAHLYIGLGSYVGGSPEIVDNCYLDITKNNYNDYADKTLNLSFEMPSGVVNPCIVIYLICDIPSDSVHKSVYLVFRNISFVNETEEDASNKEDSLIDKLLNGIKGLFVPDEETLKGMKDKYLSLFSERLGFIYACADFLTSVYAKFEELFFIGQEFTGDPSFTLPALSFTLPFYDGGETVISLWPDITISMSFIRSITGLKLLYHLYRIMLNIIFIVLLVYYGESLYKEFTES